MNAGIRFLVGASLLAGAGAGVYFWSNPTAFSRLKNEVQAAIGAPAKPSSSTPQQQGSPSRGDSHPESTTAHKGEPNTSSTNTAQTTGSNPSDHGGAIVSDAVAVDGLKYVVSAEEFARLTCTVPSIGRPPEALNGPLAIWNGPCANGIPSGSGTLAWYSPGDRGYLGLTYYYRVVPQSGLTWLNGQLAVDPQAIKSEYELLSCATDVSLVYVRVYVDDAVEVVVDDLAQLLLTRGATFARNNCPALVGYRGIYVNVFRSKDRGVQDQFDEIVLAKVSNSETAQLSWFSYDNPSKQRRASETLEKTRAEMQKVVTRIQAVEAEKARVAQQQHDQRRDQILADLAQRTGVTGKTPPMADLEANPYAFKGQTLMFGTTFRRMIDEHSAVFNAPPFFNTPLLFTGVPSTKFTTPNTYTVIVGTVTGATTVEGDNVPTLRYADAIVCKEDFCADIGD